MMLKIGIALTLIGIALITIAVAQRRISLGDTETESRRILKKSPGDGADYLVNEGHGSYWAISEQDKSILARQADKVARQQGKIVSEIGEQFPFVIKNWRGQYRVESLYVCLPETDPTRPLCPDGWEYQANTFSDNGPNVYQGLTTGKTYIANSWNGLGSCVRAIPADPAKGSYGGSESYGPVALRTTARDYPQWLAKQRSAR